jgi:type 1 glutamine amidotransferase
MSDSPRIHVLTGGPYHPVAAQFALIGSLLGDRATVTCRDGAAAFDDLDACDLLVLAGLHWTGLGADGHEWPDGVEPCAYQPPTDAQKRAYAGYVASGRPLLAWHGGTGSFDDWPEFGALLGFTWVWGTTAHSRYARWRVDVEPTGHPVVAGIDGWDVDDELYYDIAVTRGLEPAVHATSRYEGVPRPLVMTASGGRIPGAGRTAYLANGHDMETLASADFRRVIVNTIDWLVSP